MVDKLFIVKSPRSLRCSSNIFPILCPIHTGPSFHQGFHTRNGLDFLLAHGHGPVGPVRPYLLFLSSSPTNEEHNFTLFASILFDKIWRIRNQTIFAGHTPNPKEGAKTCKLYFDHILAWSFGSSLTLVG